MRYKRNQKAPQTRLLESRMATWTNAKTMVDLGPSPDLETKRLRFSSHERDRKQARPSGLARRDLQLRSKHRCRRSMSSRKQDTNQDFLLPAKKARICMNPNMSSEQAYNMTVKELITLGLPSYEFGTRVYTLIVPENPKQQNLKQSQTGKWSSYLKEENKPA